MTIFLRRCIFLQNKTFPFLGIVFHLKFFLQLRDAEERHKEAEARVRELEKQVWKNDQNFFTSLFRKYVDGPILLYKKGLVIVYCHILYDMIYL